MRGRATACSTNERPGDHAFLDLHYEGSDVTKVRGGRGKLVERPIKGLPVVMIGVIGGRVADLLENRTNNVALPVFNTPTTC
eukprot:1194388-Prorocentrum_minimum.AAC.4